MVLAPINTDAPIYHWPRATVGLIAANLVAFLAIRSGALGEFVDVVARYGLVHGAGLKPWQWITSNFVHRDWLHLAGNMLFLWGLGLVVEGKIGWRKFLILYLTLGIVECALEQTAFGFIRFQSLGFFKFHSYGSSAIVFGLLAVALVWAPKNDLVVAFGFPAFGIGTFDVSISLFAFFVLGVQGLLVWWIGPAVLLHLIGMVLGFVAATAMLRWGLVDCEGWDLFSVLRGRPGTAVDADNYTPIEERPVTERPTPEVPAARKMADPERGAVLKKVKTINRVRVLLKQDRPRDAYDRLRRTQHLLTDWHLPAEDHLQLAEALQRSGHANEAVMLWEEFLEQHPRSTDHIRIAAAEVALEEHRRPNAALRLLEPLNADRLHPSLEKRRRRVVAAAQKLVATGVIEFDQAAWR